MQGHDGKPSIQCIYKETKNESNLVTCSLQAEREDTKRFIGLCVWQDGEAGWREATRHAAILLSEYGYREKWTYQLSHLTRQRRSLQCCSSYQCMFLSSGGRKNWNLKKSVPGAMELCAVPYTGPVTVVSGFCMVATKLIWLLPIIQWWSMMIN